MAYAWNEENHVYLSQVQPFMVWIWIRHLSY